MNKVLRLENNVPEYYVSQSRDFQVLMRLLSIVFNSCRQSMQQLEYMNDSQLINERLVPLLQTKVGFYTDYQFQANELRDVCETFYSLVKNKGSRKGIELAIRTFFNAKNIKATYSVEIINEVKDGTDTPYTIRIGIGKKMDSDVLLREILKYVIPTGYDVVIYWYTEYSLTDADKKVYYKDGVKYATPVSDREHGDVGSYVNNKPNSVVSEIQTIDTTMPAFAGKERSED